MSQTKEIQNVLSGPNEELLEAQARVCTGPHQSRPLGVKPSDPDPDRIYSIIVDSLDGRLPQSEAASRAQIGAFLVAMSLRRAYPERTNWSESETRAVEQWTPLITDPVARFLISAGEFDHPSGEVDHMMAGHLGKILRGKHLEYAETRAVLAGVMAEQGDPMLKGAVLIGQRMNLESEEEFRAYMDSVLDPTDIQLVSVSSLTTIGEPYNGSTRYFKPTCFVAAVRAALGRPTLLHGVDIAPPKNGVTEAAILAALGANPYIPIPDAAKLIEDPEIGFAYLSQSVFAPHAVWMSDMRVHIKKRPTWAASEKAQQILKADGRNDMVVGFYHPGYESKQLQSMRDRGFDAGCVIKGEEGTSQLSLRAGAPSEESRKTLNYVEGFAGDSAYARDIEPAEYGFDYTTSPRVETVSGDAFAKAGRAALSGEAGHVQDRIVMNAGLLNWLLGYVDDPAKSIQSAREAVANGSALAHLERYIQATSAIQKEP